MSLNERVEAFDHLSERFENDRPGRLLLSHQIRPDLFKRLQTAAALYISKGFQEDCFVETEQEILEKLDREYDTVSNITPNGMIVPKRYNVL